MNSLMTPLVRLSLPLLFCAVFSTVAHAYTSTGNLPLQAEASGSTWDTVVADAKAESTPASPPGSPNPSSGGTPIYHSTQLEETTLEGDFTADVNTTSLAIFSDDGCDVTIDGNKIWADKDNAHALEDLKASLHKLSITLNPGQTYHIKIDYSNVYYTGDGDIDGVTLFTWSDPIDVTVDLSGVDSVTLTAGVKGSGPIKATVSNAPQSTANCTVTSVEWNWDFGDVQYSADGETNWGDAPADTGYDMTIDDVTVPTTNFNMTLDPGYWAVILTATVTYHTTCGDISGSDWDYVGQTYTMALPEEIKQPQSLLHTASFGGILRRNHTYRPTKTKTKKRVYTPGNASEIITSPIEASKCKVGTSPTPVDDTRNADGSITVDSVLQYVGDTSETGGTPGWRASSTFSAQDKFTDPYYTWSVVPVDHNQSVWYDNNDLHSASCTPHFDFGKPNYALPLPTTIKLHAKDRATGINAYNTYTINWHLPDENWADVTSKPYPTGLHPYPAVRLDSSEDIESTGSFTGTWDWYNFDTEALTNGGELLAIAGEFVIPEAYVPLLALIPLTADNIGTAVKSEHEKQVYFTNVWNAGVDDPQQTGCTFTPPPTGSYANMHSGYTMGYYRMKPPVRKVEYHLHTYQSDHYDSHGYYNIHQTPIEIPTGYEGWGADFYKARL